jgi:ubiquinone/menaquinone biosynthesis C-methylase UbiE
MTALDIGCGPGFISIEMATMAGESGEVISADLQEGMLRKLRVKIGGTELEFRIRPVTCDKDKFNTSNQSIWLLISPAQSHARTR